MTVSDSASDPIVSRSHRWRWLAIGVFILSAVLNFLDRQILAQLAPVLQDDLGLTLVQYGWLISAFSAVYAFSAPVAGWALDRFGLTRGMSWAVGLWSAAGFATGFAQGFWSLVFCRGVLAAGEAAGVPGSGKSHHLYLPPREYALGSAAGQMGLSIGGVLAPPLATWFALNSNWRYSFLVAGALGFLWIPLWRYTARKLPPVVPDVPGPGARVQARTLLRDPRMAGLFVANILTMTVYSLWLNWTTVFLVRRHGLSLAETQWLAGLPPVFLTLGGISGGLLAWWMIRGHADAFRGRMRICWAASTLILVNALAPLAPTPQLAMVAICMACFWTVVISVNLYSMPLDLFPGHSVAFAVSLLTAAYGVLQFLISPMIGKLVQDSGFGLVCAITAPASILACTAIWLGNLAYQRKQQGQDPVGA
jgi:MFS transporter, ACS family, hexuronate transporter